MFGLPLLSATRNHALDTEAVAFLQRNLGLQRFYTLGPLTPNYSAQDRVASINHNYQPIPQAWVAHVKARLDPALHAPVFTGNYPGIDADGRTRLDAFRRRRAAFAADTVRYVLVHPGQNPLAAPTSALTFEGIPPAGVQSIPLGGTLDGALPSSLSQAGAVAAVDIMIGTYHGAADGDLVLRLCSPATCVEGRRSLAELADNQPARFALEQPLPVTLDQPLRLSLAQEGATRPVAIWVWRTPPSAFSVAGSRGWLGDPVAGLLPRLSLSYAAEAATSGAPPGPVHHGRVVDIFELPDAAPYFEAQGGPCQLDIASREALRAECEAPAVLIRREFAYEGWRATVNGSTAAVRPVDGLFQATDLPAGESEVRFAFAPPHIGWTLLPFALGLAGCLAGRTRGPARCEAEIRWRAGFPPDGQPPAAAPAREPRQTAPVLD
ncbi:hypothetical protein [Dankookia sp. P2]|uniref:hypothetical protein n=1 Tax=Dankookia sp. P2 TaxID=3423955 RepID=UPI003D67AA18